MHDHPKNSKKVIGAIIFNLAISITAYVGGIVSGSLALISEAGHNLTDVLALGIGYAGERLGERPSNKKHSFGYKRAEVLAALINAIALIVIAIFIIVEAVHRWSAQTPVGLTMLFIFGAVGLIGNVASIWLLNEDAEKTLNRKAMYLHLFYDVLSSVAVIISGIVIWLTGTYYVDLIVSIGISAFMLWNSLTLLRNVTHLIMQGVPDGVDMDAIRDDILSVPRVNDVHTLHVWGINSEENVLSCHLCTQSKDTDSVIKEVNALMKKKHGITHTTIQVEQQALCKDKEKDHAVAHKQQHD